MTFDNFMKLLSELHKEFAAKDKEIKFIHNGEKIKLILKSKDEVVNNQTVKECLIQCDKFEINIEKENIVMKFLFQYGQTGS